jgi:peptide/nickel transport system substrate-binding protein
MSTFPPPADNDQPARNQPVDDQPAKDRVDAFSSGSSGRLRWQLIVLGIGLLMIAGGLLFLLLQGERPADTPVFEFSEIQTYSEAAIGEPLWVNPLLATAQPDRELSALIFSGLTRLNQYGEPVPDLAERWEVSADGLTYIFHLRRGASWHDGIPFTAADVAFTMSLLRDPDYPGPADRGAFWRTVETYQEDDYTVRFVLTQPLAAFPEYAGIGLLPAHILAGINPADLPSDPFNLTPVGTGRLQWAGLEKQKKVTIVHLKPYSGFYDVERRITNLDDFSLHYYTDPDDAFRALGDVQGFGGLTQSQLKAALSSPDINVYTSRLPAYAAIVFNQQAPTRLPFFQEEDVRRALTMGLNRRQLVEAALPQQALVARTPILPGTWAYNPAVEPLPYATNQASQLLDETGWLLSGDTRAREGVPLAFVLLVSNRPVDRQVGEMVVEQWRALGADVSLQTLSPPDLLKRLQSAPAGEGRDFDAVLVEYDQGRLADPDPYPFWHESQFEEGQNFGGSVDYDISRALEIARKERNGVRRAELYRSFQEWFVERAVAILLYNPVYHYAVSCQVQGVQLMLLVDPADRFRNLHEWRILSPEEAQRNCSGQ